MSSGRRVHREGVLGFNPGKDTKALDDPDSSR